MGRPLSAYIGETLVIPVTLETVTCAVIYYRMFRARAERNADANNSNHLIVTKTNTNIVVANAAGRQAAVK